MNRENKKQLQKALNFIYEAKAIMETEKDTEQEKYDNLSEGLQASERGQKLESDAATMDEVFSSLEDLESQLTDLIES